MLHPHTWLPRAPQTASSLHAAGDVTAAALPPRRLGPAVPLQAAHPARPTATVGLRLAASPPPHRQCMGRPCCGSGWHVPAAVPGHRRTPAAAQADGCRRHRRCCCCRWCCSTAARRPAPAAPPLPAGAVGAQVQGPAALQLLSLGPQGHWQLPARLLAQRPSSRANAGASPEQERRPLLLLLLPQGGRCHAAGQHPDCCRCCGRH